MDFFNIRKYRANTNENHATRDFFKSTGKDENNKNGKNDENEKIVYYKEAESRMEKMEHNLKDFLRTSHQKKQWEKRQKERKEAIEQFVTHYKPVTSLLEKLNPMLDEYQECQKALQNPNITLDSLEDMQKSFKETADTLDSYSSFDKDKDIKDLVEKMDRAKQQMASLSIKKENQSTKETQEPIANLTIDTPTQVTPQAEDQMNGQDQDLSYRKPFGSYSNTILTCMEKELNEVITPFVNRLEDFCRSIGNEEAGPSEPGSSSQPASLIIEASKSSHLDISLNALDTKFQQLLDQIQQKRQEALALPLKALQETVKSLGKILFQNESYEYSSDNEEKLQNVIEQAEKLVDDPGATPQKLEQKNTRVQEKVLKIVLEDIEEKAVKLLKPYADNAPWVEALQALDRCNDFFVSSKLFFQHYEEANKSLESQATTAKSTQDIIKGLITNTVALPQACEKLKEILQLKDKDPDFGEQATAFSEKFKNQDQKPSPEKRNEFRKQYITAYVKDRFCAQCDTESLAELTIRYPYQKEPETSETDSKSYHISLQNHEQELLRLLDPDNQTEETFENKVESIVGEEIEKFQEHIKIDEIETKIFQGDQSSLKFRKTHLFKSELWKDLKRVGGNKDAVSDADVICFGESHYDSVHHQHGAKLIEALAKDGYKVVVLVEGAHIGTKVNIGKNHVTSYLPKDVKGKVEVFGWDYEILLFSDAPFKAEYQEDIAEIRSSNGGEKKYLSDIVAITKEMRHFANKGIDMLYSFINLARYASLIKALNGKIQEYSSRSSSSKEIASASTSSAVGLPKDDMIFSEKSHDDDTKVKFVIIAGKMHFIKLNQKQEVWGNINISL